MKNNLPLLTASILTVTIATTSGALYAHSENHAGEAPEFDPVTTEFGQFESDMHPVKTIEITMTDQMRFTPSLIHVNKGDVIRFVHTNPGQLMHEFVLGTESTLDQHAEMMKKFPGMEHSEPYMSHVQPGSTGEVTWKFSNEGEFSFGCLIPGHYDAGMKGKIVVAS